jgi:peptidoglycan/xylan/chitin deacetylase (PgdA/CDA1 family)
MSRRARLITALIAIAMLAVPVVAGAQAQPREIGRGNQQRPEIAMTFDCGASAAPTPAILEILRDHNVRASFYITGEFASRNRDLVRRIGAEHEVSNHSWTHRDFTTLSNLQIEQELIWTEEILSDLTGATTRPYWRAPFGARNARVMQATANAGWHEHVFWTVERRGNTWVSGDSGDWRPLSPLQVQRNIINAASLGNGVITVSHCGSDLTARSLHATLRELRAMGLEPVTVSRLLQ